MTSIPRSRIPRQSQSSASPENSLIDNNICLVVGLTCIAGFIVDILVIATPPDPFALEWRIGFLQQASDRSVIFFFGIALLLYSIYQNRQVRRSLSLFCLAIGVAFLLSSLLVIRDSLTLKDQAFKNIGTQEEQIQSQIADSQASGELPSGVSLEQIQQASQEITSQAELAKQNTNRGIVKAGMASLGNLVVVGAGLIGLGRIGMRKGQRQ